MVSAYFNTPPANELDERIAAGLLLLTGLTPDIKDPKNGVTIPPFRPENYTFETKAPGIIAGLSVCMVIITIVTLARLSIRLFARECKFGSDDWLMIPAYILGMAYPALQIAMVQYGGAGKHFFDITYQEYYYYKILAPTSQTCFYVYVGLVKMSIACFNIRLAGIASQFWRYVNYSFLVACLGYTLAALFLNVFKCRPAYASYNLLTIAAHSPNIPKCMGLNDTNAILRLNLALDFVALAIPVILLWKVQMMGKRKKWLFGLLSIGLVACVASIMTLVSQYTLQTDPLWNYTTLLAWIMVELVVSIVAASAPTLTYLFPRKWLNSGSKANSSNRLTQSVHTSRLSKADFHQSRARQMNGETSDSDEEDQRILVKQDGILVREEIELKSHSIGGTVSENLSVKSYEGNNAQGTSSGGIYDGPGRGEAKVGVAQ